MCVSHSSSVMATAIMVWKPGLNIPLYCFHCNPAITPLSLIYLEAILNGSHAVGFQRLCFTTKATEAAMQALADSKQIV